MDTQEESDASPVGDLLVGADPIEAFLKSLGMPDTVDAYYLKKKGWPIGKTGGNSGQLIASKPRLARHIQKLTAV